MQSDWFTLGSFAVFASATSIVMVLVNVIRHVFGWGPRWFGLLVALGVAVVGAVYTGIFEEGFDLPKAVIVLLNGFLLYATAFGVQNVAIHPIAAMRDPTLLQASPSRLRFGSRW